MPPRKLPELEIPFLDGSDPWQVINASKERQLDRIDSEQRQLVSWLTLPMATQFVTERLIVPLEKEGIDLGYRLLDRPDFLEDHLDTHIAKIQKLTRTGSARPKHIHYALDPAEPHQLAVLVPTAQRRNRYATFYLEARLRQMNNRGEVNSQDPPRGVSILMKKTMKQNTQSTATALDIPGNPSKPSGQEADQIPITERRWGRPIYTLEQMRNH